MQRSQMWDISVPAAAILALCLLPQFASAEEAVSSDGATWLSYCRSSDTSAALQHISMQQIKVETETPADLKLPADFGKKAQVGRWTTPMDAAGFRQVALSCSKGSELCDQLVIDSNGDGRLDDETITQPYYQRQYGASQGQTKFGPIAVHFKGDDGPILYHLNFTVYCQGAGEAYYVMAMAGGWYQGTVTLNGVPVTCQLIDYNANGTFNDVCDDPQSSYESADRVRFTDDPDIEPMFAGRYVSHGQQLYEFAAARDGAFVKIHEAAGLAVGTIKPMDDCESVTVFGPQGSFILTRGEAQQVPAGKYKLQSWQMKIKDKANQQWNFTGSRFPEQSAMDVTADGEVALKLGGPWNAKLEDRVRGRAHTFNQALVGRYGERIDAAYANGSRPPAPRVRIVSEDGKYDKTFKFEYG